MTVAADLIRTTRNRYLLSGAGEMRNRLAADYTAGQVTLTFTYPLQGIQAGTKLSVGLNTFYVWAVNSSNQTATVEGGADGTTDLHASIGDTVTVDPAWSDSDLFAALNEELVSLSSPQNGLFQMRQTEFTYNAARAGYDLPGVTDVTSLYEVRYAEPDPFQRTPRLDAGEYRLERNYLTGENSSTYSLKLSRGGWPGQPVTVLYKAPFTPLASLTTDLATTGLPGSAADILPLGAAIRVAAGRELRRNDLTRQGDTRRAEEVTAGASAAATRGLMLLRQTRIMEETARLQAAYPPRRG